MTEHHLRDTGRARGLEIVSCSCGWAFALKSSLSTLENSKRMREAVNEHLYGTEPHPSVAEQKAGT